MNNAMDNIEIASASAMQAELVGRLFKRHHETVELTPDEIHSTGVLLEGVAHRLQWALARFPEMELIAPAGKKLHQIRA